MKRFTSILLALAVLLSMCSFGHFVTAADTYHNTAEFTITDTVTNEDVGAFGFNSADSIYGSSSPITNQMISGGGFEPIVYRNRYPVTENDDNTIYSAGSTFSHYDSFAQGFYDGGEALIYRPVNGALKLVRRSRIKSFNCSDKSTCFGGKVLTTNAANVGWSWWERDCTYYFSVAAVDENGNQSPLSDWIGVDKKAEYDSQANIDKLNSYSGSINLANGKAPLPAPINCTSEDDTVNKCAKITWDTVDNAAGYVLYTSYYPPEDQKGNSIELVPGGEPLKRNDMAVVRKNFYDWSREKYLTPRIYNSFEGTDQKVLAPYLYNNPDNFNDGTSAIYGDDSEVNWRLLKHTDTPADFSNPGSTYMHIDLGNKERKVEFGIINHAGPNGNNGQPNDYYKILEFNHTYRVEFWAKSDSDTPVTADVYFNHFYSKLGSKTFTLTKNWSKYCADFTIPDEENDSPWIGQTLISFRGSTNVDVDSIQMYDTCTEPNMWFERDIQAAKDSGSSYYRNNTFIMSGMFTYSMDMLCNPAGAFNKSAGGCTTLDSYLRVCKKVEVNPWFQIEMHMSPDEWLGWAEFMCATYDPAVDTPKSKPYAYKRYLAGQTKPWIEEFDKIMFEISNETWNGMFAPWNFTDTVDEKTGTPYNPSETYGLYQEFVLDIFRYCKYSKILSQKLESVLGGWSVNKHESYAGQFSPSTTYLTRTAYNGGWDEGTILSNDEEGYFYTSVYGIQKGIVEAKSLKKDATSFGDTRSFGAYEAGPGYPLPNPNLSPEVQAEHKRQNEVQKSLAGAVSTLDTFLLNAADYNYDVQNFYKFARGESYWTSHASIKDGGQEHLAFKALTLFNNFATGDFVKTDTVSAPTIDIPQVGSRPETKDAPMVATYTVKNGNKYNVFVLSRKVNNYPTAGDDGYTPVKLNLPFRYVNGVTVRRMIGDPKATNIRAENIEIEKKDLSISDVNYSLNLDETTGAEAKGVGPCSIYLYSFDVADNQPATPTPIPTVQPTGANAVNMIINSGFEERECGDYWAIKKHKFLQGWLLEDMTAGLNSYVEESKDSALKPISGDRMLEIDPIGGANDIDRVSQNVECKKGREYKLSFYTSESTESVFKLCYSCVTSWINNPDCGNSDHEYKTYLTNDSVTKTDAGNGWTKVEGTFTCINDCAVKIVLCPPDRAKVTYFDDVRIEDLHPETIPTAAPIAHVTKPPYVEGVDVYYPTEPPEYDPNKTQAPPTPTPSAPVEITATPDFPSSTPTQSLATTTPTQPPTQSPTQSPAQTTVPSETSGTQTKKPNTPRVGKPKLKTAESTKNGKIKLAFTKVARAAGYRIACSTVKSFKKKNTRLVFTKGTKFTFKKLKKGKTYHVRVQAYIKTKGKRIYGKFSKTKHVRVKK